jgi:hypothetical protein
MGHSAADSIIARYHTFPAASGAALKSVKIAKLARGYTAPAIICCKLELFNAFLRERKEVIDADPRAPAQSSQSRNQSLDYQISR